MAHKCSGDSVRDKARIAKLEAENRKLREFIAARCCCKSVPGPRTCSYCEVLGAKNDD